MKRARSLNSAAITDALQEFSLTCLYVFVGSYN